MIVRLTAVDMGRESGYGKYS